MIKEILLFMAAVCGDPAVLRCDVIELQENRAYDLHVYTTNLVADRNEFMSTGGNVVKINAKFFKVLD